MLKIKELNEFLWTITYHSQHGLKTFSCDIVHLHDRIMLSGTEGHQVFSHPDKKPFESISNFLFDVNISQRDEIKGLCQLHTEGTVDNERAAKNVDLLTFLSVEAKTILKEKILSCDCSPSTMRKKLNFHFGLTKENISLLDLEDENSEMRKTMSALILIADYFSKSKEYASI